MEDVGKQKHTRVKWFRVHTRERIPWASALKEIFSEEFNYIIEIITAGKPTGRSTKNDNRNG